MKFAVALAIVHEPLYQWAAPPLIWLAIESSFPSVDGHWFLAVSCHHFHVDFAELAGGVQPYVDWLHGYGARM